MEENIQLIGGIREVVDSYKTLKALGLKQTPTFVINHVSKIFEGRQVQSEMRNQNNENQIISRIGAVYKVYKTLLRNGCEEAPQVLVDNVIEILGQETLPPSPPSSPGAQPQVPPPATAPPQQEEQEEEEEEGMMERNANGQVENETSMRINEGPEQDQLLLSPSTSSSSTMKNHKPRDNNDKREKRKKNRVKLSDLKRQFKCVSCSAILNNNLEWWRHKTGVKCKNARIECLTCEKSLFRLKLKNLFAHERVCTSSVKSYGSGQSQLKVRGEITIMSTTSVQAPVASTSSSSSSFPPTDTLRNINPVMSKSKKCPMCKIPVENSQLLESHLQTHLIGIKCNFCEKIFIDSPSHDRHMEQFHSNSTAEDNNNNNNNNNSVVIKVEPVETNPFHPVSMLKKRRSGKKCYLCHFCQKECKSYYDLKQHIRVHSKERPFSCHLCSSRFTQKSALNAHVKRHGKSSRLDNRRMRNLMAQQQLIEEEDDDDCPPPVLFPCVEYSSAATQNENVEGEFVEEEEDEQDPLQINPLADQDSDPEYDPRSFSLIPIRYRRRHGRHGRRRIGQGSSGRIQKRFGCSECGKMFKSNYDLIVHIRVHTNERPFSCPYEFCGAAFKCQSSLNSHTSRHQNPDGTPREVINKFRRNL